MDTRNKKSPWWDGHWFYQGQTMHVVDKLLCCAKMYLVKWDNQFKMKHSWIEHHKLLFYIKETCHAWHKFDTSWDVIDNCKMSKKEKKEMELERQTFLGSSGGCNDIDTFLLDEDWHPMLVYDEDSHIVWVRITTQMLLVMLKLVMLKLAMTLTIDG